MLPEQFGETRITRCPHYLRVDFGDVSAPELSETYRHVAHLWLQTQAIGVLLNAGDNDPQGHRRLGDALSAMARASAMPPHFKLALVPSSHAIKAVFLEAQEELRAVGLNAWVFPSTSEAVEWLEGRAASGPVTS